MDSQTTRVHGQHSDQEPQSAVVEGDQGEHHEKMSVMMKVKARAKKMKETFVPKSHGHDHDHHENDDDDHELDEEDEHDEEKLVQDSEVHGAPKYESAAAQNVCPGTFQAKVTEAADHPAPNIITTGQGQGHDMHPKQTGVNLGGKSPVEDFTAPKQRHEEPANNETRVSDLGADGKEAGITPISQSLAKMDIRDKTQHTNEPTETGSHDQFSPTPSPDFSSNKANTTAENTIPVPKSYNVSDSDENRPENMNVDQPNQGGYTDKISSVTSAIADKAVSAKNVVASKLGYGGSPDSASSTRVESNKGGENAKTGGGVADYGRQIASTVTEKLAPVCGKVAGAGSAVVSKIPGTGMITHKNTGESSQVDTGRAVGETDKGVASVTGYIAEKLKPGEEDKALSEVISGALHKPKVVVDNEEKKEMGQVVSDAFHKRSNEEEMGRETKPMGKVTESEKVADRLGSSESERSGHVSGNDSPGKGVVDKFKGAFTSWFGKGGETKPSQAFNDVNTSQGTMGDQGISGAEQNVGERRLQESTN